MQQELPVAERRVYGVGELLTGLRHLLEDRVGRVWVAGEVSNLFRAASGHAYFTLKDAEGQLRAVLFRGTARRLRFELEEGEAFLVYGDLSIYEARGTLQLVVRQVEPQGRGALQLAFEQLRRRLEAEGLFTPERKRPLPAVPRCVGVVTSPVGAALRDVIQVSGRRYPDARLLLAPTRVQGEGAEHEVAAALDRIGARDEVDLVLLVRGGGSLEDLWSFNTETVVRAVVRCGRPVVCGVGHETDFTLAEAAADARAPTPSAAAELALPDRGALAERLAHAWERLAAVARARLGERRHALAREREALRMLSPRARLAARRDRLRAARRALRGHVRVERRRRREQLRRLGERLLRAAPDVERSRWRAGTATRGLVAAARRGAERRRERLGAAAARLEGLSPLGVLARGYAVVWRASDGRVVRGAADAPPGEHLRLRVARAEIRAEVRSARAVEPENRRDPET